MAFQFGQKDRTFPPWVNSDSDFGCHWIHYLVCLVIISEIYSINQDLSIKNWKWPLQEHCRYWCGSEASLNLMDMENWNLLLTLRTCQQNQLQVLLKKRKQAAIRINTNGHSCWTTTCIFPSFDSGKQMVIIKTLICPSLAGPCTLLRVLLWC